MSEDRGNELSNVEIRAPRECGRLGYAFIAPRPQKVRRELPTVLAISGEEQLHVSKFFRAWRAEERSWQVVVPLRPKMGSPYLFDQPGVEAVANFALALLDDEGSMLPHSIEGRSFHLVGASNGGAAVLALAAKLPEIVASLTLVTGFIPEWLEDLASLRAISSIHLYAGDQDELGHNIILEQLQQQLEDQAVKAELHILPGARHFNVGNYVDMEAFWEALVQAREAVARTVPEKRAKSCNCSIA
eukprot:TRINITY_DN68258_c0_g1_i1.p1 TRINITY_DN68258_c0_g1~~TRINITY_DN68258_c0_g1_i1.p1  ORF type:complete len:260 (-),score=38.39 TRINITY_DN68258_c0_g1_i1:62-796(-)